MGSKQFKKIKGFTLVELIAVVAIISMIAVYITIEINQSADDAKVGLATSFLATNVPAAISSYRAQNMSSCRNMSPTAGVATNDVTTILTDRGIAPMSAWDIAWSANYNDTTRVITVTYPIFGDAATIAAYAGVIDTNLEDVPGVADSAVTGTGLTIDYNCF